MREILLKALRTMIESPADLQPEQVQQRVKDALGPDAWAALRGATLFDVMKEATVGDVLDLAALA